MSLGSETPPPTQEQKEKASQPVVRMFVVSLPSAEELWKQYQEQKDSQNDFHVLRFYLGMKGDKKNLRFTFLGGKVRQGESLAVAAQRELVEEGGFSPLGIPWQTEIGKFTYKVPNRNNLSPRQVSLTYFPVKPTRLDKVIIGDEKISDIKALNIKQLRELVKSGQLEIDIGESTQQVSLEEHLSLAADKDIFLDEEYQSQQEALKRGLSWMEHIEKKVSQVVLNDLEGSENLNEFTRRYEQVVSRFMRRGFEVAVKAKSEKKSSTIDEELEEVGVGHLGRLSSRIRGIFLGLAEKVGFKESETKSIKSASESLNTGYLGKDVLFYLPEIVKHSEFSWPGLPEATSATQEFVHLFKGIVDELLEKEGFASLESLRQFMKSDEFDLQKKHHLINSLNHLVRDKIVREFNISDETLDRVIRDVQIFFQQLSSDLKESDLSLIGNVPYQDFATHNEVLNANLGKLILLFAGINVNGGSSPKLRFEAGRQLALILKSLGWVKEYQAKTTAVIEKGQLQLAVDAFFGQAEDQFQLQVGGAVFELNLRRYKEKLIIVDEKPVPKTPRSMLRKSFFEPSSKIVDYLSVSVVMNLDLDQNQAEVDYGVLISESKGVINEFYEYLQTQYPELEVEMVEEIREYGIPAFLESQKVEHDEGKRAGSKGNRFLRYKTIFKVGDEYMEFLVYPFLRFPDPNFMGWLEKIEDDRAYGVRRNFLEEKGRSPFYFLLYPPEIYHKHYEGVVKSSAYQTAD